MFVHLEHLNQPLIVNVNVRGPDKINVVLVVVVVDHVHPLVQGAVLSMMIVHGEN
jgi:hypothetical protein